MPTEDFLAKLPETDVAAFYQRLANFVFQHKVEGADPLAAIFLAEYLKNRDPNFTFYFRAPNHLKRFVLVKLGFHRDVFLTKKKAIIGKGAGVEKWAGVIPRLQGLSSYAKWDGKSSLSMNYETNAEVGTDEDDIKRIQQSGADWERDLFTSLRGFTIRSEVWVTGTPSVGSRTRVAFTYWKWQVIDKYDFDKVKHITLPNPDYHSQPKGPVAPDSPEITIYHTNAIRIQNKHLACEYNVRSVWERVTLPKLLVPEDVDASRKLS